MKCIILTVFLLISAQSFAAPVKRFFQDGKLPTQELIERQSFTNPEVAAANDILSANAGNTSAAAATVSTFVAQPDLPRSITITPAGTTADVASCSVVVSGTNFYGESISESFAFAANASTVTVGSKAFKTVSSVLFPAACEDTPFGATWSVGYGEKLGLKRCMGQAGDAILSTVAGVFESTRATVAVNATAIESNTADFNGTMDGAADFDLLFIQNFRCFP